MIEQLAKVIIDSDKGTMEINGTLSSMEHTSTPFSNEWTISIIQQEYDDIWKPTFLQNPNLYEKPNVDKATNEEKEDDTMTIERIKTQKMSAEEFEESKENFDEMTIWLNVDKVDKFKEKYGMELKYEYNFYDDIVEISPSAFKIRGIVIPKDFVEFIEVKEKVGV
jgi:hypothetical protein